MKRALSVVVCVAVCGAAAPAQAKSPGPGPLDAAAWTVVDARDKAVIRSAAADERRPVASATKLMTALVALERLGAGREVEVAGYSPGNPAESLAGLEQGDVYTVEELIAALLMVSANDAATELARAAAGDVPGFAALMNRKAAALGLGDTAFTNPIGLDEPGNYSTAADLARLAAALLARPLTAKIADTRSRVIGGSGAARIRLENTNALLARDPWVDGVKTGQTLGAGWVMVASGTRDGTQLIAVVLGASSEQARYESALRLLNWGFGQYREKLVAGDGEIVGRTKIEYGDGSILPLRAAYPLTVSVRPGAEPITTRVEAPDSVEGPVRRGEKLGLLVASSGGRRLGSVPLVAARRVGAPSLARTSTPLLAGVLIATGLLVIMAGAGAHSRRRR